MTRRMLINAQRPEELRVAIVDGNHLESFHVDVAESGLTRGNIYRGTIANVQPSLNAAFIEYGAERHGFLSIQDVVEQAWYHQPAHHPPRIDEVLDRGKSIVVQVAKDAIGQKGAALTTNLSLAGRYLVLTPFDDTRGVSRKVEDEDTRKKLKQQVAKLALPPGCGVIVRTNALEQTKATLSRDLAALLRVWKRIQTEATRGRGTALLYNDQDLIIQALRDHLDSTIAEVVVDDDESFERVQAYIQAFLPRAKTRLVRYAERLPLFSRYNVEAQIDRIYEKRVELPSGGSIIIESTEALTAIDVNSGRSTRAATQEETAVNTNVEAASEVARQLRLRDLGGLVVVDFIDMRANKNQRKVEKTLKDAMKSDKARSSVGRISPNGLLEINRQRIRQALAVRTHRPCPTCAGSGSIASPEIIALNLLRRIEAKAATGALAAVKVALHPELADAVQNHRRQDLAALEREFDCTIEILAAAGLHRAEERIEWTKRDKPIPVPPRPMRELKVIQAADFADFDELDEEEEEEQPQPARRPAERRPDRRQDSRRERSGQPQQSQQAQSQRPAQPAQPAAQPAQAGSPHPEEGAAAEGTGKRKRRRRGGRKRKKHGAGTPPELLETAAILPEGPEELEEQDGGEEPEEEDGEAEAVFEFADIPAVFPILRTPPVEEPAAAVVEEAEVPAEAEPALPEPAAEEAPAPPETTEEAPGEPAAAETPEGESPRPRKRRPPRRRRSVKKGEEGEAAASGEEAGDTPAPAPEEPAEA